MNNLAQELNQFTGCMQNFFNPLYPSMEYTEGVKYFAEQAGTYWFLDIVGTEINAMSVEEFLVILLDVKGDEAVITCNKEVNGEPVEIFRRDVGFTDCPEGEWKFWLIDQVMILPSEY